MRIFKRKNKNEENDKEISNIIENLLSGSGFKLISFFKDYKHFGNMIVKIFNGDAEHTFITDRGEIVCDGKGMFSPLYKSHLQGATMLNLLEAIELVINRD